ncbi:MAG: hypothetical protein ABI759_14215 [Candidatus Solibacter sp.]
MAAVCLSVITLAGGAINVYVGLRLAALQSKMKADASGLEVVLLKQFALWNDEVLSAINGKYVTAALVAEMRSNFGHELQQIDRRLERIEERCADRLVCALQPKQE